MPNINEKIVLVGGGGGVYRVAKFLRNLRSNITTIQTVFDHGGHSGDLRDERGILPPGDLRQAILALSDNNLEPTLRKLMGHRFSPIGDSPLNGNTIGNLLLTALVEIEGSLPLAIKDLCRLCGVKGNILPVSLDNAELCVEFNDGSNMKGEGNIDTRSINDDRTILWAYLEPNAHIFVEAYDALISADKIVLCPGDIYTSLVPNLLVDGFKEALSKTKAQIIYIVNLMTKKAETDKFSVRDFLEVVFNYIGRRLDLVIYNSAQVPWPLVEKYELERSRPVNFYGDDSPRILEMSRNCVGVDLLDITGGILRHSGRVASVIADS